MDVGGNGKLSYQVAAGWFGRLIQNFVLLFLKNPVHYKILLLDSESVAKHPRQASDIQKVNINNKEKSP